MRFSDKEEMAVDIGELTTQEKSVMLIKARGEAWYTPVDLYAIGNMSVAWMFLNWAMEKKLVKDVYFQPFHVLAKMPPKEIQAVLLDTILRRAIEANLITLEPTNAPL